MKFIVRHVTKYSYEQPVSSCHNIAYMVPRNTASQQLDTIAIAISPTASVSNTRTDYFGNQLYQFSIEQDHSELEVEVTSHIRVDEMPINRNLDFGNTCAYSKQRLQQSTDPECLTAREFLLDSPMIQQHADLAHYAAAFFPDDRPFLSAVMELTEKIYTDLTYDPGFSDVATPLSDVMKHKRGVCQDFAHFAIGCLRSLGYPARYVSGYLETLPPPGQEKLVGADATHAWFGVFSPGEGWFEFDPTNNKMASEQHITTAWGRDYSDVTPLKGVIFGGGKQHTLSVSVDVQRLAD